MNDFSRYTTPDAPSMDMSRDEGLRSFMLGVYNKMGLGLLITGALAWTVAFYPPVTQYFFTHDATGALTGFTLLGIIARFAPLALLLGTMFIKNISPGMAAFVYWFIVAAFGISGAVWFIVYDLGSIAQVFAVTAIAFGGLSLVGYTTKKDLSGMGSFLIMALIGLIVASIVNMFLQNSMFDFIISLAGVVIFAGLIAYDTQKLKSIYYQLGGSEAKMNVATSFGALELYLDFINLFTFLLRLMGDRR
ncbi:Bax inhibitor-1/YccA family protein [Asticcacaulis sp. YBE204]|uniref:Bax inhibitor-1/YccA family protein n=1 Tax=Asticcacaulis sp. YBE204 TaxID=1282363 RepID=UPI0003C3E676|nr:Bax inhibitor-1/YccA family protein [Asticcacaulis sp. YBE204]ESQ78601.1 hypothetical protein AEYBE204_13705 [Asticcacaulis sp. YBE204]